MLLVAVMFVVVVAALVLAARAYQRRQLDDARAQARHWVERLGGELLVLDGAAVRCGAVGPAGLAEAAERFAAAGAELGAARSRRRCRIAQGTAVEVCTTFGRREARSASIPALGSPVRAWEPSYVRRWPTGAGKRRGWSTRYSPMRPVVPGSCLLAAPNQLTGSACSNSTGRDPRQFAADRHVTAGPRAGARSRRSGAPRRRPV